MEFFEPPPSDNMDESYPPNPFDNPFDLPNMGTRALSTLQQPELPSESLDDLFGDDQDEP